MVASAGYHGLLEHLYPKYGSTQTYRTIPPSFPLPRKADLGESLGAQGAAVEEHDSLGCRMASCTALLGNCFPLILMSGTELLRLIRMCVFSRFPAVVLALFAFCDILSRCAAYDDTRDA